MPGRLKAVGRVIIAHLAAAADVQNSGVLVEAPFEVAAAFAADGRILPLSVERDILQNGSARCDLIAALGSVIPAEEAEAVHGRRGQGAYLAVYRRIDIQRIALAAAGVEHYARNALPLSVDGGVLCEFIRACDLRSAGGSVEPAGECVAVARWRRQRFHGALGSDIGVCLGACTAVGVELDRQKAGAAAGFVGYVPYLRDVRNDVILRAAVCCVPALRKLDALCGRAGVGAVEGIRIGVVIGQQHRVGDIAVIDLNALGVLVQQGKQRGFFLRSAHVGVAFYVNGHAHIGVAVSHARAVYPRDRAER